MKSRLVAVQRREPVEAGRRILAEKRGGALVPAAEDRLRAITPKELAQELGLSVVRVNGILHELYPRTNEQRYVRWVLSREQADAVRRRRATGSRAPDHAALAPTSVQPAQAAWFWEGNVQSQIASHLAREGWQIIRVASTGLKERGDDILARRAGRELVVEVKGYPSVGYADPRRADEVKRTQPSIQAHVWLADAIVHAMRILGTRDGVDVAIGLPRVPRYERLLSDLEPSLRRLGVGVMLVTEGGDVGELLPTRRPDTAKP